jgi:inosine/xanthosine triphosphatase
MSDSDIVLDVYVASTSSPKLAAANLSFSRHFTSVASSSASSNPSFVNEHGLPCRGVTIHGVDGCDSGVSSQPFGDEETRRGAINRLKKCIQLEPNRSFYVAFEGGVGYSSRGGLRLLSSSLDELPESRQMLECFAWVAVLEGKSQRVSLSRTASFVLPPEISSLVKSGVELGDADDKVFGRSGGKGMDGTVGKLTNGVINRAEYYAQALQLALIPFTNGDKLYKIDEGSL